MQRIGHNDHKFSSEKKTNKTNKTTTEKMPLEVPTLVMGDDTKRQRMEISDYGGLGNFSTDGSSYDPSNPDNVVASNGTWSSEHVNDDIDINVVALPSDHDPTWVNNVPIHALVFSSATEFTNEVAHLQKRGKNTVFRAFDCRVMYTPEQMNYDLHTMWLKRATMNKIPTLEELFNKWSLTGTMNTPPGNSHGVTDSFADKRVGDQRHVDVRIFGDCKVLNYLGSHVSGTVKPYFFMALKYMPIVADTTTYILSSTGDKVYTVYNYETDAAGKPTKKRIEYVPQWVAICGDEPHCPDKKDLECFMVVNGIRVKKRAPYLRVGRIVINPKFQGNQPSRSNITELRNMAITSNAEKIDVLVNINDYFQMCN